MHLRLGIENQINHIHLIATRNPEIGELGDIEQLLSPFPNRNTSTLAQLRHSFFVKCKEKHGLYVSVLGGMKRRIVREDKLWSRKDEAWFRSEPFFHCILLLSLKILQTYMTKPDLWHKTPRVVSPTEANTTL